MNRPIRPRSPYSLSRTSVFSSSRFLRQSLLCKSFAIQGFLKSLLRSDIKYGCPTSQRLKNEAELANLDFRRSEIG